jgi:hypothetical protein
MYLKSSPHGPRTSWRDGRPANKGDKAVHQLHWEQDSPQYKNTFWSHLLCLFSVTYIGKCSVSIRTYHNNFTVLYGFVQFFSKFGKVVNFCSKTAFYTLKHFWISKFFSKNYSTIGFVGIVTTPLDFWWQFILDFVKKGFNFLIKNEYFPPNIMNCVLLVLWAISIVRTFTFSTKCL